LGDNAEHSFQPQHWLKRSSNQKFWLVSGDGAFVSAACEARS
jgi:hypothetical protein